MTLYDHDDDIFVASDAFIFVVNTAAAVLWHGPPVPTTDDLSHSSTSASSKFMMPNERAGLGNKENTNQVLVIELVGAEGVRGCHRRFAQSKAGQ